MKVIYGRRLSGYDRHLEVELDWKKWRLWYKSTSSLSKDVYEWSIGPLNFVVSDWVPY